MGARANKKLMQDLIAASGAGNRRPYLDALSDDVTFTVTGQNSWSRTHVGKEAVLRDLYGVVRAKLAEGRTKPFRFLADGDFVVVEAKGDMLLKDGRRYDNDYCLIFRLKKGRIVEIREYNDSILCEDRLGPYPA